MSPGENEAPGVGGLVSKYEGCSVATASSSGARVVGTTSLLASMTGGGSVCSGGSILTGAASSGKGFC